MGMQFGGFDAFDERLVKIEEQGPKKMNQFIAQEAEVIRGKIQDNTPVDTGRLKGGWKRSRAVQGKADIYNNVEYAAHVEYGHRTRGGKGFVRGKLMLHRGMLQAEKTFRDDADAIIKAVLGE
jgi:hypothetical protein|nr:MAG TPA: putative tail component [Caudoviricetes sp.]